MQDNNIIGVVRSATDTEVLQGLISLTTFRGNEEVFLIKRDGDVVLATSDVVDGSNNIYTLFDEDDESYSSIVKVINQERSMLKSTSINGQEYKIYHQGIEGIGNWGVIIAIPSYQLIELYTSTSTQEVKSRWLPNGDIEYLGRIDEQVKIRGFRIELGEIENTIRWYKGIRDVAVIAKPDRTEDMTLYAYYVCNEEIEPLEIKEYLKKTLPNYMIPNHIQKIDEIPITISGKLDKKRLPDIETVNEVDYHPPRNDIEEKLSICYSNVLGVERVGIDENFFEMGGNSIKAMKFTAKLKEYGYELSINDILNHQSIRNIYDNCFSQSKDMKNIYDLKENNLFDNVLGIQEYVQSQL